MCSHDRRILSAQTPFPDSRLLYLMLACLFGQRDPRRLYTLNPSVLACPGAAGGCTGFSVCLQSGTNCARAPHCLKERQATSLAGRPEGHGRLWVRALPSAQQTCTELLCCGAAVASAKNAASSKRRPRAVAWHRRGGLPCALGQGQDWDATGLVHTRRSFRFSMAPSHAPRALYCSAVTTRCGWGVGQRVCGRELHSMQQAGAAGNG